MLKNWCFELWCWSRLLRVPWTARRSNQSILKEISPEYSLEGLMLKLKLQHFGHLMRRAENIGKYWERFWCWERLNAAEGDNRGWDGWMTSLARWTWVWANSGSWWWTEKPAVLQPKGSKRVGHDWATKHCQHCLYTVILNFGATWRPILSNKNYLKSPRNNVQLCPHSQCVFQKISGLLKFVYALQH